MKSNRCLALVCAGIFCIWGLVSATPGITAPQMTSEPAPQVQAPDTPAGQQLSGWLSAFNSGVRETISAFQSGHFDAALLRDPDRRLEMDLGLRERTGGFELKRIESSAPLEITVLLKERNSQQWARLVLRVSADEAHRITELSLRAILSPPTAEPPGGPSENKTLEEAKLETEALCQRDEFSGVVLIAKGGEPVLEKACGMANRERGVANRPDTKFNLGSMNKMFTAVAIAQLAEKGKLNFRDTINKYVPDYPDRDAAAEVTIEELLTHTSGLGDIFGPEFARKKDTLKQLSDYIPLFANAPLQFEPGTGWAYSNAGFIVLGVIIEKVSGENYYDYVRGHIFETAGMSQTDSYWKSVEIPNLAVGYTRQSSEGDSKQPRIRNDGFLPLRGTSAGGGYSTSGDLVKFAQALLSHKLLNADSTRLVLTGKVATLRGSKYAYGFDDRLENGKHVVGHNGGSPGVNAQLDMYLESQYTVVVLSNYDPPIAERIADHIASNMP